MAKKNKISIERNLSQSDIERLEILQRSEEVKGEQLTLNLDAELAIENEAEKLLGLQIDDPDTKHQLYYQGLTKLMIDNLPKGKENEDIRKIIYGEKGILINRGKKINEKGIRGSDGRMAFLEDLEIAIKIVADWVSVKGTPTELFMAFWDKNEELGYPHQD